MKDEQTDNRIEEVFERAASPLGPELRERALREMAGARIAVQHPRRRFAAAAAGVLLIMFIVLGFAPFPSGKATGAWERAVAAASQARTAYVTGYRWSEEGMLYFKEWLSEEGFHREEWWKDEKLTALSLDVGNRSINYEAAAQRGSDNESPPRPADSPLYFPDKSAAALLVESFEWFQSSTMFSDVKVSERRARTLWHGARDIVEMEGRILSGEASIKGINYKEGDAFRIVMEIDPSTDHMLSEEQFRKGAAGGSWKTVYRTEAIEWNVEIPDSLRQFSFPKGTKVTRVRWWSTRLEKIIAQASTPDWEIRLYAIDVNRQGDLYLTLSRRRTPKSRDSESLDGALPPAVQAADNSGVQYHQQSVFRAVFDYWVTALTRSRGPAAESAGMPQSVTLKIIPYPDYEGISQSVILKDLPLPPRQDVEGFFEKTVEEVQF